MINFLIYLGSTILGAIFRRLWGSGYANYYMLITYIAILFLLLFYISSNWLVIIPVVIIAIGWRVGFNGWADWWNMTFHYTRFTILAAIALAIIFSNWWFLLYAPVGLIGLSLPILNRIVPRNNNAPMWDYKAVGEYINGAIINGELVGIVLLLI